MNNHPTPEPSPAPAAPAQPDLAALPAPEGDPHDTSAPLFADRPVADAGGDGGAQVSFAGHWQLDAGGVWRQHIAGVTGPEGPTDAQWRDRRRWGQKELRAPRWLRRRRHTTASGPRRGPLLAAVAVVAVASTLATTSVAETFSSRVDDLLRGAPEPLLAGPVDPTDSGAEELYKAAAPSVLTLLTDDGSAGTGFVYQPGLVLTNWHVVASSAEAAAALAAGSEVAVTVVTSDSRQRTGTVLAADPELDLALVAVEGIGDLPALPLGDPDLLDVGQPVYLLGSPFGIPRTMTSGMITGININTGFAQTGVQNGLLMTDAAANPGNSGGPLLTADGTVVGVVTLRPDESGGRSVQGLTFALPADTVAWSAAFLERGEIPVYPLMGINGGTASPDLGTAGVIVTGVTPGGASDLAGVRVGDIVTAIDGAAVDEFDDLVDALRDVGAGGTATFRLARPVDADAVTEALGELADPEAVGRLGDVARTTVEVEVTLTERPRGL